MENKNHLPMPLEHQPHEQPIPFVRRTSNEYLHEATSRNTRKAYRSDIRHFEAWGGRLPTAPQEIVAYLEEHASKLNPRTLSRRLIALKHWHVYQGFTDPTLHPVVTKTLAGITRVHGIPKEKARPVTPAELTLIAHKLQTIPTLAAARDNALLQIGFFGAFRRSELTAICIEHINWQPNGIEILLPSSKTDQTHEGQFCVIPPGTENLCPISALKHWLSVAQLTDGALFRGINQFGILKDSPLSPLSVNLILKQRAEEAGILNAHEFSSHSLRRGLATSAANAGAPLHIIMRHGRWKQVNTVVEYIEAAARFTENAATHVFAELKKEDNI